MGVETAAIGGFLILGSEMYQMSEQAGAAKENADFYRQQADYSKQVGEAKKSVLLDNQFTFLEKQKSAFARAGISFSTGSAAAVYADTKRKQRSELASLTAQTNFDVLAANKRASSEEAVANTLSNPFVVGSRLAGGLLTTASMAGGRSNG